MPPQTHSIQQQRRNPNIRGIGIRKPAWQIDKGWADAYWPAIEQVIRNVTGKIAVVHPTAPDEDQKLARDYCVERLVIACRLRRAESCPWRDFTIRTWRKSGIKTEREKIREGLVRWYLFAWVHKSGLCEWWLIDCSKLVRCGLRRGAFEVIPNKDSTTAFIAIRKWYLEEIGAIVAQWQAA